MQKMLCVALILVIAIAESCNNADTGASSTTNENVKDTQQVKGTYGFDADFLRNRNKKIAELKNDAGARVLVSADYQGRVMTSSSSGDTGRSYGWINYNLIAAQKPTPHMNAFGGEERFWIGPEGGQYAFFFKPKDSFVVSKWQVPAIIDTLPFEMINATADKASFKARATLENYNEKTFEFAIERTVILLDKATLEKKLGVKLGNTVQFVGYETDNLIRNTGIDDWTENKGLMSIWLLGQMMVSDQTKVFIPFTPGSNSKSLITSNYFGPIPADRLQISDSVVVLKADGKQRGKIGLSPQIAKSVAASYDFNNNVLTIILFPVDQNGKYVNSKWEMQREPYKGDVVNAYNDGPLQDGTQMGPFYEIESSSAAKPLKKGETQEYKQVTCHFEGSYEELKQLATAVLHVDLDSIRK